MTSDKAGEVDGVHLSARAESRPPSRLEGGMMEVRSQPCKFGSQCMRPDCWFSHDAKPEPVSCKFGEQCTRANCWFDHPGRSMPAEKACKQMPPCKDGLQCTRSDCWFQHPEGWDAKATPCLHGARCTRVDCWFNHPADRPDPRSEEVQRERYARSVFVGRLAVATKSGAKETKDEDLTKYFEQFGEIVVGSVTRANNSRDGKSRGFGLVEFRTKEAAEAALKKGHPTWAVQVRRYQPAGGTFIAVDRSHRVTVESQIMHMSHMTSDSHIITSPSASRMASWWMTPSRNASQALRTSRMLRPHTW